MALDASPAVRTARNLSGLPVAFGSSTSVQLAGRTSRERAMEGNRQMTSADWSILIPAIAALLTGVGAWLRAQAAHTRVNVLAAQVSGLKRQSAAAAESIRQLQQEPKP